MALKSLIVVATGGADDAGALGTTAKLGAKFGARVLVAPAFPDPAAELVYYGASLKTLGEAGARIVESERAAQERLESLGRDVASREGVTIMVEKRALQPAVALAPAAILSDLVVFSAGAVRSPLGAGLLAETLLSSRVAVMIDKGAPVTGGAVAIAWDGSAQAARAVRAALPLIKAASGVVVLHNVEDQTTEFTAGTAERLMTYLALHGVKSVLMRDVHGARVAESLLAAAKAEKCELLVAGAYGRPRLFEMVLGGTTRALVEAESGPNLLLAH